MHACTINSTGSDSGSLTLCVYRMVKSVSEGTFAEVHVYRDWETLAIKVLIADSYLLNSEFVSEGTFAEVHVYRDWETLAIKVLIADSYLLNSEFGVYPVYCVCTDHPI